MIDNTVWYYKKLDFPELPLELKVKFDQLAEHELLKIPDVIYTKDNLNEHQYFNYLKSSSTKVNNTTVPGGEMIYSNLTPEFETWFRKNISATAGLPRFAAHKNDPNHPITFLGAHCDFKRNYALNYVHRPGGSKVKTVFYQEEGYPVIRELGITWETAPKLIKLAEINIPVNTWHLLRTDIIHSVEYMTSPRIRITSDPDQAEVDSFEPHVIDILK